LGINGNKIAPIVNKIININRDSKKLIKPSLITNNDNDWNNETPLDLYIDFETLSGTLYDEINILNSKACNPFLFMIGVGYIIDDEWIYNSFTTNDVTPNEEKRILNEFEKFIASLKHKKLKPKMYHWSNAEKSIITTLNRRHNKTWLNNVIWCDIYKLFIDIPIVVKGSKKFALKDIAKAMKSHNMISSCWSDDGVGDGLTAMKSN
jgi:hypothetical protein